MQKHPKAKETIGQAVVTLNVSREAIEYILCTAFEGGSNYWIGGGISIPGGADMEAGTMSECLAYLDQELLLEHDNTEYDGGPTQTATLTAAKLVVGIQQYLAAGGKRGVLLLDENEDCGDINDTDLILQFALFGKAIFGYPSFF